jgi:serine O-acetyltransferase
LDDAERRAAAKTSGGRDFADEIAPGWSRITAGFEGSCVPAFSGRAPLAMFLYSPPGQELRPGHDARAAAEYLQVLQGFRKEPGSAAERIDAMGKIRTSPASHAELERIVHEVADSYGSGRGIDSLESAALPNQRKVVDAVEHLKHVLYMGFYATRDLNPQNLPHYIGDHVYEAFECLVEQISRAVVYRRKQGGHPETEDVAWSEKTVLAVLGELPRIRAELHEDLQAAYDGDPAAESLEEIVFSYPAIEAITCYRIAREFFVRGTPLIPRIISEYAHTQTGIDIHPGANIGHAFFIDHGTGVVIGSTTVIGDGVKIYQGVTLGALSIPRDQCGEVIRTSKRHPTIEDDVTIYAGATILGGATVVGRGSVIGGNVWITESVPPNSRVTYQPPTCMDEPTQTVTPRPAPRRLARRG